MKTTCLLISIIYSSLYSQIIDQPRFSYEQLKWGEGIEEVKALLKKKDFSQVQMKEGSKTFLVSYVDTIKNEAIGVGLQFAKKDSVLVSIMISYLGIDPATKKQYENYEEKKYTILGMLTEHYRTDHLDRSIPFIGTVRMWTLKNMKAQAQILSNSLVLILSER